MTARTIWKASQRMKRTLHNPGKIIRLVSMLPVNCNVEPLYGETRKYIAQALRDAAQSRHHGVVENWIEHMAWAKCYRTLGLGFESAPAKHLANERRMLRRELARRRQEGPHEVR